MPHKVTVGGVDKTAYTHSEAGMVIERTLNERDRAQVTFNPSYLPARLSEIAIYAEDDVTQLFGGLVLQRAVKGLTDASSSSLVTVECADYAVYFEWCYVDLSYAEATTLGTVLTALVAALPASYGITLSGTYTDALAAFTWTNMRASDGLRELATRTGRSWKLSMAKVLTMPALPDGTAPESFTDADPNCLTFEWADPADVSANTVLLSCGAPGTPVISRRLDGTGAVSSWTWDGPPAATNPRYTDVAWIIDAGETYDTDTDKSHIHVHIDTDPGTQSVPGLFVASTLTFSISTGYTGKDITAGVLANGHYLLWEYYAQFPFTVEATTGATPRIETLLTDATVTEWDHGVELAEAHLDVLSGEAREVTAISRTHGWEPGQALDVALTGRSFVAPGGSAGSFEPMAFELTAFDAGSSTAQATLVKSVSLHPIGQIGWEYRITAVEADLYDGSYQDEWRQLVGLEAASPAAAVSTPMSADIGLVAAFAQSSAPSGWLLCNGAAVSRTTYSVLYDVIGTTFGVGDGSTTFNVPDLRGRFILGQAASGTGSTFAGTGGSIDHDHAPGSHTHDFDVTSDQESAHTHDVAGTTDSTGSAHTHTGDTDSQGDHTHTVDNSITVVQDGAQTVPDGASSTSTAGAHVHAVDIDEGGSHTHGFSDTSSAGTAHDHGVDGTTGAPNAGAANTGTNNPPFLVLIWCIKAA